MVPRVMVLLFTVVFAAQLGLGLITPLLPIYAQDLGASGLWLGIVFAVFSIARFIAMPIVGRYSDVHGRRMFIIVGLTIYTIISMTYIFATSPMDLTIIRFSHGINFFCIAGNGYGYEQCGFTCTSLSGYYYIY